jgi:DNA (cytosine-5)-methyltransferase 1
MVITPCLYSYHFSPGEVLPDFPEMTHSENSNLGRKTYTTPRDVLQKIPRNAPNHRIAKRRFGVKYRRWDDLQPINCITTSKGVHWSHPRGRRALTDRELASLSGFPLNHIFFGKEISKQIGNAVPPSIAKIWFTHILSQLERADALELAARNRGVIKIDID